jgi:glycosyltransferase involved in cell wall biosynthesis
MKPKISVLLCTYNNKRDVSLCLESILRQKERSFEILCIDGGSTDGTIGTIKEYSRRDKRIQYVNNPNRLPEGKGNGKWLGFRKSRGQMICIIDQDNILQHPLVFTQALSALGTEKNAFGALAGLKHDIKDAAVVRYVSLVGTDSFFAYRSVDFLRQFKKAIKKSGYDLLPFSEKHIWITGGNCFFYRKKDIQSIGGYEQDVPTVSRLVKTGKDDLIILPGATKHYAESSLTRLVSKKFKWGKSYFNPTQKKSRSHSYLSTFRDKILLTMNFLACITLVPYFLFSFYLYAKKKDPVILLFPVHAFLTTLAYALTGIKNILRI